MDAMHTPSSDVAFTPTVKAVQARKGSREAYRRVEERGGFETRITPELGEFIAAALEEEHRNFDVEQVFRALVRGLAGWVKRESQKDEAADARQRRCSLSLRSHPATKGFAAGEQGQVRHQARGFGHDRTDRGVGKLRCVRPF